MHNKP
ncbi:hypothetical protein D050_3946A, partial [Vibrio parahaemolyticus VPCR-2009]